MSAAGMAACPRCGTGHPADERFCPDCGMPLAYDADAGAGEAEDARISARRAWARKIRPQYAEGRLVQVAGARHLPEAEFIQGLLLEEGVPSTLRRTRGFDVPEMLAAGPRDVLVPESGWATAREVLLQAEMLAEGGRGATAPARVAGGLLGAVAFVGLLAWVGTELIG